MAGLQRIFSGPVALGYPQKGDEQKDALIFQSTTIDNISPLDAALLNAVYPRLARNADVLPFPLSKPSGSCR